MAKFEDYAKVQNDRLASEIDEAGSQAADRKADNPSLPERFQGKTPEEIAQSYVELERKFSQQGNDLGTLRKTVDEFMTLQLQSATKQEVPERKPASIDDLYTDADDTIRRVVNEEAGSRIAKLENELATERFNAKMQTFDGKYPGWRDHAGSPEFIQWVQQNPARVQLALSADQRKDIHSAETLLDLWFAQHPAQTRRENPETERQLRQATLESSGAEAPHIEKPFSRAKLLAARIAAKRGDEEAATYLKANHAAIAQAYNEGKITD